MDEPLASLDEERKAEILPFIEQLRSTFAVPILYISHAASEVARLASTVVVLDAGRVVAMGSPADVLTRGATLFRGAGEAGSLLTATVAGQEPADRLTRLAFAGTDLFVPQIDARQGTAVSVHIHARDVMLALVPPQDVSALNVIPARVTAIRELDGPTVEIRLDASGAVLLAHVTGRSVRALSLAEGAAVYAVLKSVAVNPATIARDLPRA